mgnify:CR=1 FL=1
MCWLLCRGKDTFPYRFYTELWGDDPTERSPHANFLRQTTYFL